MNRKECMLEEFGNRFGVYKQKNIVFYLKEFNPTPYFNKYSDFKFIGIMDNYINYGSAFDKEILSYERAVELQTEMIIIASEPVYFEVIRKRIAGFCRQNHILLFTIDGTRLSVERSIVCDESVYFNLNAEWVKEKINTYNVISFDVYDTLLMKRVLSNMDLYELIADQIRKKENISFDFSKMRMLSQKELENSKIYVTLELIYKRIKEKTGITSECAEQLMNMERDLNKQLTIPRYEMLKLFQYAVSKGKRIFLVEDSYLSRSDMETLLKEHGIVGYEKLLLSCEEKKMCLFRKLLKYTDNRILYIGTAYEQELNLPKSANIDICRILSVEDMLSLSVYGQRKSPDRLYEKLKWGLFAAKIFNSPFALFHTSGRGKISKTEDIAYLFVAPLVMDFMFWFVKKVKEDEIDEILFGARDGYLVEKLYQLMIEQTDMDNCPHGIYFWTSRLICTMTALFTAEDIKKACNMPFIGSPEQLLAQRYMLSQEDILKFEEEKYQDTTQYILEHTDKILSKAEQVRKEYLLYGKKCGIHTNKKIAFFDFVASGTCQKSMEKIFQEKFRGYYFYRLFSEDKLQLDISSYIEQNVGIEENSLFMECIFTSSDPAVALVDESGNPLFTNENRTNEEIWYCEKLQNGILDYVNDMTLLMSDFTEIDEKKRDESFLEYLYPDYTIIENELFHKYVIKDEFIGCESHVGRLYRY